MAGRSVTLPPGQRRLDGFPRFGTHMHRPPPEVSAAGHAIEITGAVDAPFALALADLATLPRRELTADFHCVAGWSATGLRWEGVPFAAFYDHVVRPALRPGPPVTHVAFAGLDGHRSAMTIEDACAEDVLLAEHLDGRPLDGDHGAPVRLVSPRQYGFVNTKHLSRVELLTEEPELDYGTAPRGVGLGLRLLGYTSFSRARVWAEERGTFLPTVVSRPVFRLLIPPIRWISARGSR